MVVGLLGGAVSCVWKDQHCLMCSIAWWFRSGGIYHLCRTHLTMLAFLAFGIVHVFAMVSGIPEFCLGHD